MDTVHILIRLYPIVAVFTGLMMGLYLNQHFDHQKWTFYLEFPALLLLNVLKFLIVPYVVSCIITIITTLGNMGSNRLMALTLAYYAIANVISVILAASLSSMFFQLRDVLMDKMRFMATEDHRVDTIEEIISSIFPEDVMAATFEKTLFVAGKRICFDVEFNSTTNCTVTPPTKITIKEPNLMGLMFFAVCFGCIINHMGLKGRPLRKFFHSIDAVVFMGIKIFLWYIPLGSMFLMAIYITNMVNFPDFMLLLLAYTLIYLVALSIHCCLTLPFLLYASTQQHAFPLVWELKAPLLNSFLMASSSAALPETLNQAAVSVPSKQYKGARHVCMVLCAALIKDGTTIYLVITSYFILHIHNEVVSGVELIIIFLCSVLASMMTAGLPQSGLTSLAIVLCCAGTPLSSLVYVVACEWIADHLSSPANVWSSYIGAEIIFFYVTQLKLAEKFQEPEPTRRVVRNVPKVTKRSVSVVTKSNQSEKSGYIDEEFDGDDSHIGDDDDEEDGEMDNFETSNSRLKRESTIS